MKWTPTAKLALCCCLALMASSVDCAEIEQQTEAASVGPRVRQCFDAEWHFFKGDVEGAEQRSFDHFTWRSLDLPHDWSIEGPYDARHPSGAPGGYLPCGIGWYRKSFRLPAGSDRQKVFIEFDGVHMNGEVWINGHRLGKRPYGYVGFQYDLTPYLDFEGDNVLAVRVDNSLQPSSRWYTGSGIYRHVWLTRTDKLHVEHWGTQVSTPKITAEHADVAVRTTLRNEYDSAKWVTVTQTIVDANGLSVASVSSSHELAKGEQQTLDQTLKIADPALWSPESPNLYTLYTELRDGDRLADRYDTPMGAREVVFDADRGILLNGKSVIMKGMCNHHDLGPLGAALWDQALERRLRMLKEMGCNAIRTAHNPPSPELLHFCDKMGFLVINETFDEWRRGWAFDQSTRTLVSSKQNKGKARYGYHLYFDKWAERDLTDHFRRDRNHPSVIMWSIGNEVPEAQKYGELETLKQLQDLSHKLDPTRPVTVGCNFIAGANESGFANILDVVGYNGGGGSCFQYEADHERYPEREFYASEVPHSLQTRGEYRTHSRYREPKHQPPHMTDEEVFPETEVWYESSYDNAGVRISARDSWRLTKTLPFVAGEFRWTGFDYLGESGGWPRVIGNFGIIDLCNFPKDTYYFYQSQWTDKPMVHLLPHWNWPGKEGTPIPVHCYTNCDSVELILNGKSLGSKAFTKENDMHLEWLVPYAPGELKAVASNSGVVTATTITRTAGSAERIFASADQTKLDATRRDLSYVTVRMEDKDGNFAPKAAKWISFSLQGPGRLLAVANGDPLSHESFQSHTVRTFNGMALAIIAPTGEEDKIANPERSNRKLGEIVLVVRSRGLEPVELRFTKPQMQSEK
jgi:beta-galactosidase